VSQDFDILLSQIGLRLLRRRQELGMTQRELAKKVDISQTNISHIEQGEQNITLRTLWRVAEALDTTVLELMGGPPPSE
jgi:transcriptional regulator with XRE-family HTH domain